MLNSFLFAQAGPPLEADAAAGFVCIAFGLLMGLVGLASLAMWIWMLIDCVQNEPSTGGNDKVVWILVICFLGAIGAVAYYFVRRPERIRKFGR